MKMGEMKFRNCVISNTRTGKGWMLLLGGCSMIHNDTSNVNTSLISLEKAKTMHPSLRKGGHFLPSQSLTWVPLNSCTP
jgi:hypothetical protein